MVPPKKGGVTLNKKFLILIYLLMALLSYNFFSKGLSLNEVLLSSFNKEIPTEIDLMRSYENGLGNISNNGFASYSENWIYYCNPLDYYSIYKVNVITNEEYKLNKIPSSYLNIYEGWIYYISDDGIYKMAIDGSTNIKIRDLEDEKIFNDVINLMGGTECIGFHSLNVTSNSIYYSATTNAHVDDGINYIVKADLDGKNAKVLTCPQESGVGNASKLLIDNDWIYFIGSYHTGGVYKIKTDGSNFTTLSSDFAQSIAVGNTKIYYLTEGFGEGNQVYSINKNSGVKNKLNIDTNDIYTFNIKNDEIYLIAPNDDSASMCSLFKVKKDNLNLVKILNNCGTGEIIVLKDFIYFYSSNKPLHKIRL
ncbi:DUF5050 domain-containing protein [Clostridium bovifaecis]|uniref:DUF5050 domain-containing protein n=1 Tax=Clostridium bovifaecis TaxID=2184719 RepID=A0A6I6EMF0_9CLOT|nr:DUF5050 domain-containing protein [Clostridium bovifaecis]